MPATTTVRASATIQAPATVVFGFVSEYKHALQVIEGLEDMSPLGHQTSGVGARFHTVLSLGPKTVSAEIEIVELVEPRIVTWASSGRDSRSITFQLEEAGESTTVRLTIAYERAETLSAILLAPVVEEAVRSRAHRTLDRLRELSER